MKERGISTAEAEKTLREPERVEPSMKGKVNAFKFLNQRFIRVTYRDHTDHLLVITVVMRKKPFKERHHED